MPRGLGFEVVDAHGWPLPPGALLTVEPGARKSLHVKWTAGGPGAVREILHLRWGASQQLAVGLSGTGTARSAAATTAAAPSAKALHACALHPAPSAKHAAQSAHSAADVGSDVLPRTQRTLTALGPARRLALGIARRVDAGAAPSPWAARERDMPRAAQAPLPRGPGQAGTQAGAGERHAGAAHAPAGGRADDRENNGTPARGPGWSAGAKSGARAARVLAQAGSGAQNLRARAGAASPGSSAASSATVVGRDCMGGHAPGRPAAPGPPAGGTPRRGSPMGHLAPRRHADALPHTPRRPGTPGASSAASGASAAARPTGAALRLGRGRVTGNTGNAGGPETSVAVRKSFSFAHKGLWLEKQERALTVWLNSLLAPAGAGAGGDAAHPNPDTLATGRLAAQLKGLLCRRATATFKSPRHCFIGTCILYMIELQTLTSAAHHAAAQAGGGGRARGGDHADPNKGQPDTLTIASHATAQAGGGGRARGGDHAGAGAPHRRRADAVGGRGGAGGGCAPAPAHAGRAGGLPPALAARRPRGAYVSSLREPCRRLVFAAEAHVYVMGLMRIIHFEHSIEGTMQGARGMQCGATASVPFLSLPSC